MLLRSQDVKEVVRNYLKSDDFEVISCENADLDGIAAGFQSYANKAKIRFKTSQGEDELDVFIKGIPESPFHKNLVKEFGSFYREPILFNEVLNKYHDYLKDHSIPACYLAKVNEIIVLEDIAKKGFKNTPLRETFDLQHCEKTLETLAKFHALSFITERKEGRKMTELVPIITTEPIMSKDRNHLGWRYFRTAIKSVKGIIAEYLGHLPPEAVKKALNFLERACEELGSSKVYPNVLAHADMWNCNIMFSYDEQGNPTEACIFDFQLSTYKAPGYDIQLFLHCCTMNDLRERHMDHLMKLYYGKLTETLRTAGIEVEEIMSWEDFQNMLQETLPITLCQAMLFLIFVLVPESMLKDVMSSDEKYKVYFEEDRTGYILEAMAKDQEYRRRIISAATNFIKYFSNEK